MKTKGRLILIDGLPGSGKSTLAERLCTFANSNQDQAIWYLEEDREHPVHPAALTMWRRPSGFPARCLDAWRRFVEKERAATGLRILEGSLFQSTVRFMMEEQQCGLEGYIKQVEDILRPLSPAVIYLRPVDAMTHSRETARHRGESWTDKVSAYLESTSYCQARELKGSEGMHRLWADYAERCDSLIAQMSVPKLTISVAPPDSESPFIESVDFLLSTGHMQLDPPLRKSEDSVMYFSKEALDLKRSPILIAPKFHDVPFDFDRYPGAPGVRGLDDGANCQLFAYEFLREHGFAIGDLRSSDLWEDTEHTYEVASPEAFDLLMVHDRPDAWGAHVLVCVGQGLFLHLSRRIGRPAVESLEEILARPYYRYLIGFKRCRVRAQ